MVNLGKLKEIKDLRKVWLHEALDFTPWLAEEDNLVLLADAVGLEITVDETESLYHKFYDNKETIESEMGVQLEWNELPEKKASRILVYKTVDFDESMKIFL